MDFIDRGKILALAQNEEKHLNHGWFVVRNRTSEESKSNISSADRHSLEEALFGERPWDRLSEARRGTQALKRYLADILCSRIQETFPTILAVVQGRHALAESQLNKLGLSRDTTEKKRVYLTDLAQHLYTLSSQTLRGRYHGLSSESLKLRRFVREANDAFASKMIYHGCCVPFHVASTAIQGKSVLSQSTDTPKASTTSGKRNGSFFGKSAGTPSAGFGGFGSTTAVNQVRSRTPSTIGVEFKALPVSDGSTVETPYLHAICVLDRFKGFSPEELRLNDYLQAQPSFASTASGSSSFANSLGNQKPSLSDNIPDIVGPGPFGSAALSSGNNQSAPTPTPASKPNGVFNLTAGETGNSSSIFAFAAASAPSSKIYTWIREEIKNCRGTELQGTLNPDVLPALFHRQVVNWKETASSHFHSVATTTAAIVELAARTTCGDKVTAGNIQKLVQQSNRASESRGIAQIHQRFDEIVTRHLQTQNPIFETNIREARLARFKRALERYRSKKAVPHQNGFAAPADGNEMVIDLRDVTSLFDELHMSNGQNLEDDIHDTLKSYYELALHDFIEFVTQQVVESYLNDPTGPVLFFNPTYIAALGPQQIDDLGAEDPGIVKERMRLEAQLARLNHAEEIALKYS